MTLSRRDERVRQVIRVSGFCCASACAYYIMCVFSAIKCA